MYENPIFSVFEVPRYVCMYYLAYAGNAAFLGAEKFAHHSPVCYAK